MKKTLKQFIEYFETLWTVGLAASSSGLLAKHGDELSDSLKVMIERGKGYSAVSFERLTDYRAYLWHMMQGIFETVDVLVSPTLATAAFRFDEEGPASINGRPIKRDSDWMLTQIYNLTGQPACSIPIAFTSSGLPIGMQAACRRFNDTMLFQFAKWVEDLLQIPTLADH
ncbi:amidase family protein [Terrilactibacillus sp. S3-3]|nr:amidase family protein [Terrilactibacillus sp. S3-3]